MEDSIVFKNEWDPEEWLDEALPSVVRETTLFKNKKIEQQKLSSSQAIKHGGDREQSHLKLEASKQRGKHPFPCGIANRLQLES